MKTLSFLFICGGLIFSTSSFAQRQENLTPFQEKVKAAMSSDIRTEAEVNRDRNRDPIQALDFWGMKDNMTVVEFAPASGWYTKILAPVLRDNGKLYLAYRKEWLDRLDPILASKGMDKAIKLPIDINYERSTGFIVGSDDFGITDVDMFLNIREYHNFTAEQKDKFNAAVFKTLKPGGLYVIVDHTRRHMAPETRETGRREDPVEVIFEVQKAGFVLDKFSDMFYKPDDELVYEVGRKTVTGNTDRFSLIFRKPL